MLYWNENKQLFTTTECALLNKCSVYFAECIDYKLQDLNFTAIPQFQEESPELPIVIITIFITLYFYCAINRPELTLRRWNPDANYLPYYKIELFW